MISKKKSPNHKPLPKFPAIRYFVSHIHSEHSESTWQLVGVAKIDQLGTNERIQEKIEKIKQVAREAQVSSDDGAEIQGLREALSVLQTRERELHQQLEEAIRRIEREKERAEVNSHNIIFELLLLS